MTTQHECLPNTGLMFTESEMSELAEPQTSRPLISSVAGFPANPIASLESGARAQTAATSGPNTAESFASLGRDGCWLKMYQDSYQATMDDSLEVFSGTWPRSGIALNGISYRLVPLAPITSAIGSGLLPTPAAQEPGWKHIEVVDKDGNPPQHWNQRFYDKNTGRVVQKGITQIARMWPTPTVPNGGRSPKGGMSLTGMTPDGKKRQVDLQYSVRTRDGNNGVLNPQWVEWLMGFPIGWTDLED